MEGFEALSNEYSKIKQEGNVTDDLAFQRLKQVSRKRRVATSVSKDLILSIST